MPEQYQAHRSQYEGEPIRKDYAKLARKITDTVTHKIRGVKSTDPEYWGLREILTDDMVELANKMKLRHFYTFEEIQKFEPDMSKENLEDLMQRMRLAAYMEYN